MPVSVNKTHVMTGQMRQMGGCLARNAPCVDWRQFVTPNLLALWIQRVWLKHNLNSKGWNYHVHRGFPGKFEPSNLSRDNVSRRIGRTTWPTHWYETRRVCASRPADIPAEVLLLYYTISYYIRLYYIMLYYIIWYYIILYYTILYYTRLDYTILY